jgi:ketosteroid isomerase-like protein
MFTGPIEDRIAIRDLIDAYTDAVMQHDAVAWAETWAEGNSVWNLGEKDITGKANIVEAWKGAMARFSFVDFSARPGQINVHGATAEVRTYAHEFLVGTDGAEMRIVGQYHDHLIKESGRWFFRSRHYKILRRS